MMTLGVLAYPTRVVTAVVAVAALYSIRSVLHHVTTHELQARVCVHAVRTSVQLNRHFQTRRHREDRPGRGRARCLMVPRRRGTMRYGAFLFLWNEATESVPAILR